MSDIITDELSRIVDSAWDRSRKRGESIEEMKNGAPDPISEETEKSSTGLPNMEEAFNKAEENKS